MNTRTCNCAIEDLRVGVGGRTGSFRALCPHGHISAPTKGKATAIRKWLARWNRGAGAVRTGRSGRGANAEKAVGAPHAVNALASAPDVSRDGSGRINWQQIETVRRFARCWNQCHTTEQAAAKFGITPEYATVKASQLRRDGWSLGRFGGKEPASLNDTNRNLMYAMLDDLCRRYDTCGDDVTGRSRVRDGRIDVRKALAWAGHELLGLSWKSLMIFFERHRQSHTIALAWAQAATTEHKRAAQEAFDATERKEAA